MAASRASTVLAAALRRSALILAKTCSIGLKSGEYGGRNMRLAPARSIAARAPLTLWAGRLSRMTISPGARVGARKVSA